MTGWGGRQGRSRKFWGSVPGGRDEAGDFCNTPCYSFANYHLITLISSLTLHQILG
jgi:hypothetical protein